MPPRSLSGTPCTVPIQDAVLPRVTQVPENSATNSRRPSKDGRRIFWTIFIRMAELTGRSGGFSGMKRPEAEEWSPRQ
jgi:hypothetical protein